VSPDRHRRCTAPVRSPAAPGRWSTARRTHSPPRASHRLPALQRKQRACRLLRSSEPPWFLGTMGSTSRARWCRVCQATACPAAFAAAFGPGEHPDFDRAAARGAVAAPVPEAAGFCVSKQPTSSPRCSRKASRRWRHSSHHPLDALCVVIDLGHVFAQDPPGNVLCGGRAGCCLADPRPRSSMSIRGWSTWLMRMRLAMVSRRRSSVGEGVGGMGGSWLGFLVRAGLLGRGVTGDGTGGGELVGENWWGRTVL
jgi:hypothetical protein